MTLTTSLRCLSRSSKVLNCLPPLTLRRPIRDIALCLLAFPTVFVASPGLSQGPPAGGQYVLAWTDDFQSDAGNGNQMQNVVIPSGGGPNRPDWLYRTGSGGGCTLGTTTANVSLTQVNTPLAGLVLTDIASGSPINYKCGGIISTRWLQYGYYETYANVGTSTTGVNGFHTAFWQDGYSLPISGAPVQYFPYYQTEIDGFEAESRYVVSGSSAGAFDSNIYYHNTASLSNNPPNPPMPYYYPYSSWTATNNHYFGYLWTPTGITFYVDGVQTGGATTPGPFAPQNVWLTSVGSDKSGGVAAPVGNYPYYYQYFSYFQPTLASAPVLPIPTNAILIDTTAPGGANSFRADGSWSSYTSGYPNSNNPLGPQGYRGQYVKTSTVAADKATWTHNFGSADAGSYDVYAWNTTAYQYEDTSGNLHLDSASNTTFQVGGSYTVGGAAFVAPVKTVPQGTSGQTWIPLSAVSGVANTNTYLFEPGMPGWVTLEVGTEGGGSYTPHTNADSVVFVPVYTVAVGQPGYAKTGTFLSSSLQGWTASTTSEYTTAGAGSAHATWTASLPQTGNYTVSVWVPYSSTSSTNAFYTFNDAASTVVGPFDQTAVPPNGGWVSLGTLDFSTTSATVTVTNGNLTTYPQNGNLRTNAVKFTPLPSTVYEICNTSGSTSTPTGIYGAELYSEPSGVWASHSSGGSADCGGEDRTSSTNGATATFKLQVPVAGIYHTYLYKDSALSLTDVAITVTSHSSVPSVCGHLIASGGGAWWYLGDYFYSPGTFPAKYGAAGSVEDNITLVNSTGGTVATSAVKLVYSEGGPIAETSECTNP